MTKRTINSIILHCSDSDFGDVHAIDAWHKARGWQGCGYHFVITNGVIVSRDDYSVFSDGLVQTGRNIDVPGAHCKGYNRASIGICLIGKHHFTAKQLFESLPKLLRKLLFEYELCLDQVHGHHEFSAYKTCPNISSGIIRKITEYSI